MAMEPITLFARIADPAKVARRLRELASGVQIDGPDEDWRNAIVSIGKWRWKRTLTLTHDRAYYSEPNWSSQMSGMRGYFSRFPDSGRKDRVIMLTTCLKFSLGTLFEPDYDPDGDPRLEILFALAELLDGVLFTPSSLRDARGRILFSAEGEDDEDPNAVWPKVMAEVSIADALGAPLRDALAPEPSEENDAANPPTAQRVARRALALTAVTARAMLEQESASSETLGTYQDLLGWVNDIEIGEELESDEWEILQRPPHRLESSMQINSTWRLEGLVVLAWALGRFDIPPHDELVKVNPLWQSLGLFDVKASEALLANAVLRPREEIESLRRRLFAIHWRLRNYYLNSDVINFAEYARTCWFGPLDVNGLPVVKGDLALQGKRIDRAAEDVFSSAHSAAQERHQAANWLCDGPELYSEASVAT